jgi:hypothetical protein
MEAVREHQWLGVDGVMGRIHVMVSLIPTRQHTRPEVALDMVVGVEMAGVDRDACSAAVGCQSGGCECGAGINSCG